MKNVLLALALVVFIVIVPAAFAETGQVVKRVSGCDYYMVDAPSGYAILEWYGGWDPDRGDIIKGSFMTYGMHTFFVGRSDEETRAYVEDWGLSRDEALEKLSDKCD
jgi:hypothetical protein